MVTVTGHYRFSRGARHVVFSLLAVLAVLFAPLLTALHVYADWGANIRLTNALGNSKGPSAAVSGNSVHVVWFDSRDGNDEIYYCRSTDGGATWGANIRLTDNLSVSENPSIAVCGNNVHLAWHDSRDGNYEIYYKRSTDGGTAWGADTRLTDNLSISKNPSVAVSGNNIHVAWHDERDGNPEIYYKRSTDGGTTWDPDTRLTNAGGNSYTPSVAVSGNNVHIAWHDSRDLNEEIYYKRSTDGGTTWDPDTRLTNAVGNSALSSIAVSGNNIHVAWMDLCGGNWQVYYKRSLDGGTTWGAATQIVNSPKLSEHPCIAVSGNNVHVVSQDNRGQYYPKWEIYYKRSTDDGTTWGADTSLTNAPENSELPVIAVSVNRVNIVWQDNVTGNYEVFYKKYTPVPTITSFSPTSGGQGTTVVITGIYFTGTTAVSFGGIPAASFTINSDTQITTVVADGANGNITVTTPDGTATSAGVFNFISPIYPHIRTDTHSSSMPATLGPAQNPVSLPLVTVKTASLSAAKVAPGTKVTVTANVANTGNVNGSRKVTLYVDGQVETTQGVTVNSGGAARLNFNISRNEPGTYSVYVDGVPAGSFTVELISESDAIPIFSALMIALALLLGIIMLWRRQRLD